ncbi:MAG: hypothetical protein PVF74_00465 [Anaerolineales bacterium]|jgi:hypothetical protein
MPKWFGSRYLWGSILILIGLIFLVQNIFGYQVGSLIWVIILGLAAAGFFYVYWGDRAHWWALIPGFALLGVTIAILLDALLPSLGGNISGSIALGGIGLGFLAVYGINRSNWWALIPAGVMITLMAVTGIEPYLDDMAVGGVFMIGLGFTFAILAYTPTPEGSLRWALIPAGILIIIGLVILTAAEAIFGFIIPIVLILIGLVVILRLVFIRN